MPRYRWPIYACVLMAGIVGCRGPAAEAETQGSEEVATGGSVSAAGSPADPLLAEARAALAEGELPEDLRARIAASSDPAHARAKRLLAAVDGDTPDGLPSAGGDASPKVPDDSEDAGEDEAPPSLSLNTPPPGEAPTAEGGDGDAEVSAGSSASKPRVGGSTAPEPQLSLITSVQLVARGDDVELVIKAAAPVEVGTATQLGSGRLRYMLPSSGALPGALQARPRLDGVSVVDVRRGENTVQLAVELAEGWRAGKPQRAAGGAKIRFRAP